MCGIEPEEPLIEKSIDGIAEYLGYTDGNLGKEKITVSSMPKNITCIFALTAEQQEKLLTQSMEK